MNKQFPSHAELSRAIRNRHFEKKPNGLYFPRSRAFIGGALRIRDFRDGHVQQVDIDPNLLTNEGLNHILNVTLPPTGGYAQIVNWYIAPFEGNYTPVTTLTAATFVAQANEFTAYTAGTRPLLEIATAATAQTTGNTGDEAVITLNAGGNIYGAGILSAAAKESAAVGQVCLAAVRLASPRLSLVSGDQLGMNYVVTAANED